MTRTLPIMIAVGLVGLSACASSAPAPSVAALPERARRGDAASGGRAVGREQAHPCGTKKKFEVGRVFDEVAKWYPKAAALGPVGQSRSTGHRLAGRVGTPAAAAPRVGSATPGAVVAEAFARTLMASGRFDQVRMLEREPAGEDRQQIDALVRVTVPSLGIVRVREGKPDMMAAYADARAQIVVRPTGVVVWEHDEDVTHPERLPLQAFTDDGELTRQELKEVLERAGQRLANEFLYARSAGR